MLASERIEDIIVREIRALCTICSQADTCLLYKSATKEIIQCELFELNSGQQPDSNLPQGLCKTCDHASNCKRPGRAGGVWHCRDFQ